MVERLDAGRQTPGWKVKARELLVYHGTWSHERRQHNHIRQTSNQFNQMPQWMSDAGQQNYAYAQKVAQQPLQQYQGQMVANVGPDAAGVEHRGE